MERMIGLQLELPHHITSLEELEAAIKDRLSEPDSQGIVHVSQVIWNGSINEWFYVRHFQIKEKLEFTEKEKEEIKKAISTSNWWFIQ